MKWLYHIKYKVRAVFGLTSIIVVILAGNLVLRGKMNALDRSMSSIMNDRLKPSAYIFGITDAVYQKRLLLLDSSAGPEVVSKINEHNRAIDTLIKAYEHTYLTAEEEQEWKAFRQHLEAYDLFETRYFHQPATTPVDRKQMTAEFAGILDNLDHLSKIQVGEGAQLQQKSRSIVDSSIAFSTVEITLLIVLGLFTMAILSISDHVIFNRKQDQNLN